MKKCDLSK